MFSGPIESEEGTAIVREKRQDRGPDYGDSGPWTSEEQILDIVNTSLT